jgi:hypothetical protein
MKRPRFIKISACKSTYILNVTDLKSVECRYDPNDGKYLITIKSPSDFKFGWVNEESAKAIMECIEKELL